jgi:colanic acid/amylovoran biosynthesis protein
MSNKHILIINQHGENRGDESALRAMIYGIEKRLGKDVKYTIIVQFQDTSLQLPFSEDVTQIHMKMPLFQFGLLVLYTFLRCAKINCLFLLNTETRKIIKAYEDCDIVVSAPGGPYFGDLYSKHEIVHWYYVWLGKLFRKPLFLYAPSAGPFTGKIFNVIRRYFFSKFEVICLREGISKGYLKNLLNNNQDIIVTADSAIQQVVEPFKRENYFKHTPDLAHKYLVAVSAIEYKFSGADNPAEKKESYTAAIIECLQFLAKAKDCHFLFIPQLYGKVHTDIEYLRMLSSMLPKQSSWEIVNQDFDSNKQRAIFGMCDLCIASRYHPQIFSGVSGVPGICIYYEHKALGFMQLLDLEDFAFDIRSLNVEAMKEKLKTAIEDKEELTYKMKQNIIPLRARASKTSDLLVNLIQRDSQ